MADVSVSATDETSATPAAKSRLLFIDNIRWSMIILVLSMHAADTYSPFGNWYYVDRQQTGFGTAMFFGIYQSFLQAFFMAALFFIAGYFAAGAFDRKGFSRFARDRLIRLGLPTLLYMLVIGPLTQYFLSWTWGNGGFGHQWLIHLKDGEWLSETGPMWFCAVLLLVSLLYGLIRRTGWREPQLALHGTGIVLFVAAMATTTFAVRIAIHADASVLNVHPGDLPQYILMFAAGASAIAAIGCSELPNVPASAGDCSRCRSLRRCSQRSCCSAAACTATRRSMRAASTSSVPGSACGRRWSASAWAS